MDNSIFATWAGVIVVAVVAVTSGLMTLFYRLIMGEIRKTVRDEVKEQVNSSVLPAIQAVENHLLGEIKAISVKLDENLSYLKPMFLQMNETYGKLYDRVGTVEKDVAEQDKKLEVHLAKNQSGQS